MFPISDPSNSRALPFINIALILANIYVFFLEITAPNPDAFISHYALIPARINLADFTTLAPFFTAMFLHGGFLHIISNMWFLWIFGDNVEGAIGHFWYLVLYLLSGLVGNVLQFILSPAATIPMLGASGAIAGALGAYFILFPHNKIKTVVFIFFFFTIIDVSAVIMLGYWFVLQLISTYTPSAMSPVSGGIAFGAHVGGFIAGIILAKLFYHPENHVLEGEIVG